MKRKPWPDERFFKKILSSWEVEALHYHESNVNLPLAPAHLYEHSGAFHWYRPYYGTLIPYCDDLRGCYGTEDQAMDALTDFVNKLGTLLTNVAKA